MFRRGATSALVAFGVWLGLSLFFSLIVSLAAGAVSPAPADATPAQQAANARLTETLSHLSPVNLYEESTIALLESHVNAVGAAAPTTRDPSSVPSTLPVDQSLLLVWPQVVAIVALTVTAFALAYVSFMRQEIRA